MRSSAGWIIRPSEPRALADDVLDPITAELLGRLRDKPDTTAEPTAMSASSDAVCRPAQTPAHMRHDLQFDLV